MQNKNPGYQFTIFDQISDNKNTQYAKAIEKLKKEISELDNQISAKNKELQSLSNDIAEERNERNAISMELRFLESQHDEKIAKLHDMQKSM